jgi:hypothetical protein
LTTTARARAPTRPALSSALVRRNGPTTLVASAASVPQSVSASGTSGTGPSDDALLTSTSRPPSAAVICSAIG